MRRQGEENSAREHMGLVRERPCVLGRWGDEGTLKSDDQRPTHPGGGTSKPGD